MTPAERFAHPQWLTIVEALAGLVIPQRPVTFEKIPYGALPGWKWQVTTADWFGEALAPADFAERCNVQAVFERVLGGPIEEGTYVDGCLVETGDGQ